MPSKMPSFLREVLALTSCLEKLLPCKIKNIEYLKTKAVTEIENRNSISTTATEGGEKVG